MKWEKLGLLYKVENSNKYLLSHAANPLGVYIQGDTYRVYYNGRDIKNRSSVSFVDIDIISKEIIHDPKKPILTYGSKNSFYSNGISIGNLFSKNGKDYIGFMGWQCPKGEHWRGDIGIFELNNNHKPHILLGSSKEDQISLSYPHIIFDNGIYKMWYGSTDCWDAGNNEMIHVIKYATSSNAIDWELHGTVLEPKIGFRQAFSRPSVIKINGKYHMWFSYRSGDGTPYRIGNAVSTDGLEWSYEDDDINISSNGWDDKMICYPFVFKHKKNIFLLYNGNDYGKYGFGLAKLEN